MESVRRGHCRAGWWSGVWGDSGGLGSDLLMQVERKKVRDPLLRVRSLDFFWRTVEWLCV